MGTLVRHGDGDDAIWTYSPIGGSTAYEKVQTGALVLLAVQAVRLAWRRTRGRGRKSSGMDRLWRDAMLIARGRRGPLTTDEMFSYDLPKSKVRAGSIKLSTVGAAVEADRGKLAADLVYALWNFDRRDGAPLGDKLSRSVVSVLESAAFILRDDDRGLELLRDLEIRCLIHHWTNSLEVVPDGVLESTRSAKSQAGAKAVACAWRQAPEPPPFPKWEPPPPSPEELARAYHQRMARGAEAKLIEAMSPVERARFEADQQAIRIFTDGLIKRSVQ